MPEILKSPVKLVMDHINKKWTIEIIHDVLRSKTRFSELLQENPGLSSKVLTKRLEQMTTDGLIRRNVVNTNPTTIQYSLTKRGLAFKNIIFEMALAGSKEFRGQIFVGEYARHNDLVEYFGKEFDIDREVISARKL